MGKILPFEGDYLHINEANFSGSKANLYMSKQVTQDYKVKGDTIEKTVTINFKNSHKASDCNLERGGLCLNSVYKTWFRIYTPKGSKMLDSRGSEVKVTSYEDLDKTVFDGFISVRPLGTATFTIAYALPKNIKRRKRITSSYSKTTWPQRRIVHSDRRWKKKQEIKLSTDKELIINL